MLHVAIRHSLAMHGRNIHSHHVIVTLSPSVSRVAFVRLGCLQSKCLEGARFAPTVLAVREFAEVLSLIVTNIQDTTAPPPPKTPPNPTAYPESLDPPSRKSP